VITKTLKNSIERKDRNALKTADQSREIVLLNMISRKINMESLAAIEAKRLLTQKKRKYQSVLLPDDL
jgi:hypothetical protein